MRQELSGSWLLIRQVNLRQVRIPPGTTMISVEGEKGRKGRIVDRYIPMTPLQDAFNEQSIVRMCITSISISSDQVYRGPFHRGITTTSSLPNARQPNTVVLRQYICNTHPHAECVSGDSKRRQHWRHSPSSNWASCSLHQAPHYHALRVRCRCRRRLVPQPPCCLHRKSRRR